LRRIKFSLAAHDGLKKEFYKSFLAIPFRQMVFTKRNTKEQCILDTNTGKQQSLAATAV